MDPACIILDFDGTFTEVEAEAAPFLESYRAEIAALIGEDVAEAWSALEQAVRVDPGRYGWRHAGHVVAPANADPYLRATVVTNLLLDERGLLPDLKQRDEVLQRIYHDNYPRAQAAFRPDAKQVIEQLLDARRPLFVVTNSATEAVEAKIDGLGPRGRERLVVRGGAKKFVVAEPEPTDARFEAVPAEEQVPGLGRPILLRRGRYYEALRRIWDETGTEPAGTLVVGDIYELDLALPARLGANIHLLARATTPAYERDAVIAHGGRVSDRLGPVLDWLT